MIILRELSALTGPKKDIFHSELLSITITDPKRKKRSGPWKKSTSLFNNCLKRMTAVKLLENLVPCVCAWVFLLNLLHYNRKLMVGNQQFQAILALERRVVVVCSVIHIIYFSFDASFDFGFRFYSEVSWRAYLLLIVLRDNMLFFFSFFANN